MISVIVPIYNSSKNIRECIDSIVKQNYSDFEILLIDDGSKDNSLEICKEYEKKYKNIRVFIKKNTGVSDTRNFGIDKAKGEYIVFIDSDDYLESNYLKTMHEVASKYHVDVVRCNINSQDEKGNISHEKFDDIKDKIIKKDELNNIIKRFVTLEDNLASYVFLLLIRKEKIPKFDTNLTFMEDTFFYINLLLNIDSMYFINENLYTYRYNEMGASKNSNRAIKNTKMTVPVCYVGGNNQVLKIDTNSQPVVNITLNKEKGVYEIDFKDTNYGEVEFSISGQLINRCRGEWVCELTDKQIEENIPEDYKKNKKLFNDTAKKIIKEYDKEHKNDNIKVPDVIKVGKWVKKNVTYDLRYTGRNEIEATEILRKKIGVCHHFTKLFNALMYSLGYKVIYVSGFALDKKDFFDKADAHAWSLINIDGKWLPFDATWGIFSGKLPVCHVFKQYFPGGVHVVGTDTIEFGVGRDEGEFIDE